MASESDKRVKALDIPEDLFSDGGGLDLLLEYLGYLKPSFSRKISD
jgi:hypothetical protein